MDDTARVRRSERARDLAHDAQRVGHGEHAAAVESAVEPLAVEQLHDDVCTAVGMVSEVEDLDDAGVRDRGRGARLVEEPRDDLGTTRELGVEHLECRTSAEHRVFCDPDLAHPARTDLVQDSIRADLHPLDHVLFISRVLPPGQAPGGEPQVVPDR